MRYTVVWRETALQQLARVWLAAADRAAVTRAVDRTDGVLSNDPEQQGEDYFGDRYILTPLIWVLYRVRVDDRVAEVLQVGRQGIDLPHDDPPAEE